MKEAAHRAGLKAVRVITDPFATVFAYGLGKNGVGTSALIIDVARHKCDMTLLWVEEGVPEVLYNNHSEWSRGVFTEDFLGHIVLTGSASHNPQIRHLIQSQFNGKGITDSITHPVAFGAATVGHTLMSPQNGISPASMSPGTPSASKPPPDSWRCSQTQHAGIPNIQDTRTFITARDNQTTAMIRIFENRRPLAKDNIMVGTIELIGIPAARRGVYKIDVTLTVEMSVYTHVWAEVKGLDRINGSVALGYTNERLTPEQVARVTTERNIHKKEDSEAAGMVRARNSEREGEKILQSVKNWMEWLERSGTDVGEADLQTEIKRRGDMMEGFVAKNLYAQAIVPIGMRPADVVIYEEL
ncbi:Major heat shock 70 kDa protein Bb [Rhizophlyctis rosea]|nr:Major heat shock 70 kDa protein Bb [Rhizophlyctis rosea]